MADVTGPYAASSGIGSQTAVELAVEDFGGQVNGAAIQVLLADAKNDPATAVKIARQWHDQGVDMITDLPSSAMSLAVQKYARTTEMVMINNGAGTELLTGAFCSPTSIHWQYNTHALASVAKAMAADNPNSKWFVITVDHAFGRSIYNDVKASIEPYGGHIVGAAYHPFTEMDYYPYLNRALASGANVIAVGNAGKTLDQLIRQAKEIGVGNNGTRLVSILTLMQDVRAVGLYAAAGMRFVAPYYWNANAASRAFAQRFRARMGTMPSSAQIADYAATLHYLKAVEKAGTDRGRAVVDTMKKMPIQDGITLNGYVREDGRMIHDVYFTQVKSPNDQPHFMDYLKVLRVIPGSKAFAPPSPSCSLVQK